MVTSPYVIDYSGRFGFPVPPSEVWAPIGQFDQFERWWGWLGELAVDGPGLQSGAVLRGTVAPPVPYRMRVAVQLDRCEPWTYPGGRIGAVSSNQQASVVRRTHGEPLPVEGRRSSVTRWRSTGGDLERAIAHVLEVPMSSTVTPLA